MPPIDGQKRARPVQRAAFSSELRQWTGPGNTGIGTVTVLGRLSSCRVEPGLQLCEQSGHKTGGFLRVPLEHRITRLCQFGIKNDSAKAPREALALPLDRVLAGR